MKKLAEIINGPSAYSYQASIWWGAHTARSLYARARRRYGGSAAVTLAALEGQLKEWREGAMAGSLAMAYASLMDPKEVRYPLLNVVELFNTASRRAFLQGVDIGAASLRADGLTGLTSWLYFTAVSLELEFERQPRNKLAAELRLGRACRVLKKRWNKGSRPDFNCWTTSTFKCFNLMSTCMSPGCTNPAMLRIGLNCHGVVSEYDVCVAHGAGRHGNWVDSV